MKNFYVRQISSEVALVTYCAVIENSLGIEIDSLRSSIWKSTNGKWQILFHQGTTRKRKMNDGEKFVGTIIQ
jgi:hypothetical protein